MSARGGMEVNQYGVIFFTGKAENLSTLGTGESELVAY